MKTYGSLEEDDLKKPEKGSLNLSKKKLAFLAFAFIILQVADSGFQWLAGDVSAGSTMEIGMFPVAIFCILKCIYSKYFRGQPRGNSLNSHKEEETNADEVPEDDIQQPATNVVDTMKVKAARKANTQNKDSKHSGTKRAWIPSWLRATIAPTPLNSKASKFVPSGPSNTLDSAAPVFMPSAYAQKEAQLLQSEYAIPRPGSVVYRSRHWVKEISASTENAMAPTLSGTRKKSKSPEPAGPAKWVPRASQKKWVPKDNVVWTSSWSTFKAPLA